MSRPLYVVLCTVVLWTCAGRPRELMGGVRMPTLSWLPCVRRRLGCLLCAFIFTAETVMVESSVYEVLFVGRVLAGLASSMLHSVFEPWLISEAKRIRASESWLADVFGLQVCVCVRVSCSRVWGVCPPVCVGVCGGVAIPPIPIPCGCVPLPHSGSATAWWR